MRPLALLRGLLAACALALACVPCVARAAPGPLSYLTALACPSTSQCTAVGRDLAFTFDPANVGQPPGTVIAGDAQLTGVACPSAARCTAVDDAGEVITFDPRAPGQAVVTVIDPGLTPAGITLNAVACPAANECVTVDALGREFTFDPASPGAPIAFNVKPGTATALSCPSAQQCTAIDSDGMEVTFDPVPAELPPPGPARAAALAVIDSSSAAIDPAPDGSPSAGVGGISCPSTTQCTVVDAAGRESTFDPAAPGTPAAVQIYPSGLTSANPLSASSNALSTISCSSPGQCTAVGPEREFTFAPSAPATPKPVTVDAGANVDVACPSAALCTIVDSIGQEVTLDPLAPLLPNPIRIDSVATVPLARTSAQRVLAPLTCSFSAPSACVVGLRLHARTHAGRTVTLASRKLSLPVGHAKTVALALDAAGRRLLATAHELSVTLSIAQRESSEVRWTVDQTLRLQAPGAKRR